MYNKFIYVQLVTWVQAAVSGEKCCMTTQVMAEKETNKMSMSNLIVLI